MRRVYALLGVAKKYGDERLAQTCALALDAHMYGHVPKEVGRRTRGRRVSTGLQALRVGRLIDTNRRGNIQLMALPPELLRALKDKVRSLVDDPEAAHQPVDPRDVAQRALVAHGPIGALPLHSRAALVDELEAFVRELRAQDTQA